MAHLLIHHLKERLAPGCLPLFTSDGLTAYFYALTAHYGQWVTGTGSRSKKPQWQVAEGLLYGQMQKSYRRRKLVQVKQMIRLGTGSAFKEALQSLGFSGRVNTAFIERVNVTIRRGVAALARRTWATALQAPHLEAHLRLSAGLLSLRASARLTACGSARASGRDLAEETQVPAAPPRHGRWADEAPLDHAVPPLLSTPATASLSNQGSRNPGAPWPREGRCPGKKSRIWDSLGLCSQGRQPKCAQTRLCRGFSNYPPYRRVVQRPLRAA
jgi:hypothetical protein